MGKEYYKQLLDPRWQIKRLKIIERDGAKCLICKSEKDTLEIHHEVYGKTPWDVDDKYLKTLCFRCHRVVELCKKNKVFYKNFNRLVFDNDHFIYIVNTKEDNNNKPGKFAVIIHNFTKSKEFIMVNFFISKPLIEYINNTF